MASLSRIMMNKKAKRLYARMQHGIQRKRDHAESLEKKRAAIDAVEDSGKTLRLPKRKSTLVQSARKMKRISSE